MISGLSDSSFPLDPLWHRAVLCKTLHAAMHDLWHCSAERGAPGAGTPQSRLGLEFGLGVNEKRRATVGQA